MTTAEILKAARELISTPEKWIKGHFSEERDCGRCFCLFGAVDSVSTQSLKDTPEWEVLKTSALRLFNSTPIEFNDAPSTTHADVLALLDAAIAATEATP